MQNKVLSLLMAAILLLSCLSFASAEEENTWPEVTTILDDIIIGWNMGNTMDAYNGSKVCNAGLGSETCWSNPRITSELVDLILANGFNAIRLPVTWQNHITDKETMTIDTAWMDRVEEVVSLILSKGAYVILNVMHDTGTNGWLTADENNFDEKAQKFANEWVQIATRFEPYGDHLIFEGFNEILNDKREWNNPDAQGMESCNKLNQVFVDTVRATGGNNAKRCLFVTTYAAAANKLIRGGFVMPTDTVENRIAVEVHIYAPYNFTSPDNSQTTWRATDVDPFIDGLKTDFQDKGYPVVIGEFGCVDKGNRYERLTWAKHLIIKANKYNIPCLWWDNGYDLEFGLFNRVALTVSDPEMVCVITNMARDINWYVSQFAPGDINEDGSLTKADIDLLKSWLQDGGETVPYADMNYDGNVNEADLQILQETLKDILNLCSDTSVWNKWIDVGNDASGSVSVKKNGIAATVTSGGANPWSFQPYYAPLTLTEGKTYTLSFDYSATENETLSCFIMKNYGDYGVYAQYELNVTAETQHFEAEFTMEASDTNARFSFDLGGSEVVTPYTLNVTNVVLEEK